MATLTSQASLDKSYKTSLAAALQSVADLQAQLSKDQDKLTKDLKATTATQSVSWPKSSTEFRQDLGYPIDDSVLLQWLKKDKTEAARAKPQFDIFLAIYRQAPFLKSDPMAKTAPPAPGTWVIPAPSEANNIKVGVPVRLARIGRLLACSKKVCPQTLEPDSYGDPDNTQFDQVVLQIGPMYTVPLTGGTFKAETAVVALDANGLPTSIEVSEKQAAAAVLTGTTQGVATQLAALPAQIAGARLAATQAQVNQLNAQSALVSAQANLGVAGQAAPLVSQTALVNAQAALETAQTNAGLPTNQTAGLAAQTALLNAQVALINAQSNAGVASSTGALAAQTSLINAQVAQINASMALAKANVTGP